MVEAAVVVVLAVLLVTAARPRRWDKTLRRPQEPLQFGPAAGRRR